jgi:hypothetical protein
MIARTFVFAQVTKKTFVFLPTFSLLQFAYVIFSCPVFLSPVPGLYLFDPFPVYFL